MTSLHKTLGAGVSGSFLVALAFTALAQTPSASTNPQPTTQLDLLNAVPPTDLPSAPAAQGSAEVAGVAAAVSNWSPFTSEEYPPLTASNGQLITAMQCRGSYCDNVALGYQNVPGLNHTSNSWTSYFSEEGTNYRICSGNNVYMTGISCQGSYCDNVSIQCTAVTGKSKTSCQWMPWFSEEQQYSYLPPGYYSAGLQCRGSYCDDMSILACR
jgi:hypothetical protein